MSWSACWKHSSTPPWTTPSSQASSATIGRRNGKCLRPVSCLLHDRRRALRLLLVQGPALHWSIARFRNSSVFEPFPTFLLGCRTVVKLLFSCSSRVSFVYWPISKLWPLPLRHPCSRFIHLPMVLCFAFLRLGSQSLLHLPTEFHVFFLVTGSTHGQQIHEPFAAEACRKRSCPEMSALIQQFTVCTQR